MTRYLISFDANAMDHIPDEDMRAVARAAHEVAEEAMNAGVWVFGGGLENQKASIVDTDGTVTDGPYPEAVGGFWVVEAPSRGLYTSSMLQRLSVRMAPLADQAAPMATGCCNACRTCATTNIVGLILVGATAVARFASRIARPS